MTAQTGTQAVERALALLVYVIEAAEPQTFGSLVEHADLPKSTVSRLAGALERQGLLDRDQAGAFRPGTVLTRFARRSSSTDDLLQAAQPILETLGRRTGETVNLAIPGPAAVEQIAQVDSRYVLGATNWVGLGVPFHCSALGKVFLAHDVASLPKGRLEQRTEHTLTTREALASDLATVRELGPTVKQAYVSLGSLNAALPHVRAFSLALVPGIAQTQPTIDAVTPWIAPARKLVSQEQLGGLLDNLQPATASLAEVTVGTTSLLKQGGLLARCFSDVILPTGDVKLDDGKFSSGKPNYQEFWYAVTGQAGEGQNLDGNGRYIRTQAGGGSTPVKLTGGTLTGKQDLYGNSVGTPQGTKPAWPGATLPPQKLDQPCYKQALPDFANTPVGPSDAVK